MTGLCRTQNKMSTAQKKRWEGWRSYIIMTLRFGTLLAEEEEQWLGTDAPAQRQAERDAALAR